MTDKEKKVPVSEKGKGSQGRASFKPGSTTGGGSDYGQGSSYLGPDSYKQGATENEGANYDNEYEPTASGNKDTGVGNGAPTAKPTGPNPPDPNTE